MEKIIRKTLVIIGLLPFLLTSCGPIRFFTYNEPHSDWVTKWLTNPTCQPPCWENIIPGQTYIDNVADILAATQGIHILSNPGKGPLSEIRQMDWGFDRSSDNGGAQTDEQGYVVSLIFMNTYQPITTEEVILKYGNPTNVLLYDCRSEMGRKTCEVNLVYNNKGMMLGLFLNDIGKEKYQVKIEPDQELKKIIFFSNAEGTYVDVMGKNSFNYPKYYFPCNGYTNYPEK